MSRNRGRRLELVLAEYLRQWWPAAEAPAASRPGSDVLGIPGTVWENKTGRVFKPTEFVAQARRHAKQADPSAVPVTVYWPAGTGEAGAGQTLAIVPLAHMVRLLIDAGYGPDGSP